MEALQSRLVEEQKRSQQLEETLRLQVQQSSSQVNMKQVNDCEELSSRTRYRLDSRCPAD